MSMTRLIVEDDPFLRLIGVVLDPSTSTERIAAYADFFAHDLPDFDAWLQKLRRHLPHNLNLASMLRPAALRNWQPNALPAKQKLQGVCAQQR